MQKQPRLILIEGLPGAGKSTAAQFTAKWLAENGYSPRLYLEGNLDHPADPESIACLNPVELEGVLTEFPGHREAILSSGWREGDDYFISYRKPHPLPEPVLERLSRFEIYELPADRHTALLLRRWQAFADTEMRQEDVYVFECCFMQNPITVLLGKHNLEVSFAQAHMNALAKIIAPLNPVLIYLDAGEARAALERVIATRPKEWLNFVIAYHTEQGLGKARDWHGLEGYFLFMEYRQSLEKSLFDRLPLEKGWIKPLDGMARFDQIAADLKRAFHLESAH